MTVTSALHQYSMSKRCTTLDVPVVGIPMSGGGPGMVTVFVPAWPCSSVEVTVTVLWGAGPPGYTQMVAGALGSGVAGTVSERVAPGVTVT